ncbi:MAG: hypothetical protein P8Y94_18130, partial [Acidobacteriota bacterium]
IHFPIALLLVAPIFIVLGALLRRTGRSFSLAALFLMVLGTVAVFMAVETGEAAGELADRTPQVMQVLQHHQELADLTRSVFVALTVIYAVVLFLPPLLCLMRLRAGDAQGTGDGGDATLAGGHAADGDGSSSIESVGLDPLTHS